MTYIELKMEGHISSFALLILVPNLKSISAQLPAIVNVHAIHITLIAFPQAVEVTESALAMIQQLKHFLRQKKLLERGRSKLGDTLKPAYRLITDEYRRRPKNG